MRKPSALPELLAPAGSPEALRAAVAAGADAVYFGGGTFNARIRAQNFTDTDVAEAIALCHAYGVKAYMTFNTLVSDRELPDFLRAADAARLAGVDALIVADLGAAEALRRAMPDLPLHASTQCSAHSLGGVRELKQRGFCRVVPARELPREEIERLVREGDCEIEVFVHGALCVSHSGQCLFSSLVGGRSGNRGECAQPCRLPDAKGSYPLSLKDLCLAREIPALIECGVHSLKIEGRLKSPSYVYEVTSVYRRLLDEGRSATPRELRALDAVFSRSGFTDGYFNRHVDSNMLGVRTEQDKQKLRETDPALLTPSPIPLDMTFTMTADQPIRLTVSTKRATATAVGDPPLVAQKAPMDAAAVKKNLLRLGGTPYTPARVEITVDEGLMVPVSKLNALRREALAALSAPVGELPPAPEPKLPRATGMRVSKPTARFETADGITETAASYFDIRYLPLQVFASEAPTGAANGVILPPVIFDGEVEKIALLLQKARERGAKHALVGNVGHLSLAMEAGLVPHGDFRLNVFNGVALAKALEQGFADVLLSPELTLPQIRDMGGGCDAVVYGRVPLMLLEKCVGQEVGSCSLCKAGKNQLVDRRGEKFPIFRLDCPDNSHRNILVNSRPTAMSDRRRELRAAGVTGGHFIFTVESPAEIDRVIEAYEKGLPLGDRIRRI
ncbi:MAG: U32 family peptidase [Clostridia bacterium]|nr:U32 family peptidase [Clostridia bacterium]